MTRYAFFIFILSIFVLFPSTSYAVAYDLNSNTQYHLRIDGANTTDKLSNYGLTSADLNGNGKDDLIIAAVGTDYNSRNASGSIYILYDSLLDDYVTKGNTLDLNSSTSYNVRIDGPAANGGVFQVETQDINNDGTVDLLISGDAMDQNSRANSGSAYVLYNSIVSGFSGTGNTLDLNTSTSYNLRIDGAVAGDRTGTYLGLTDIDQNSKLDLFLSAYAFGGQGSTYMIKDSILDDYTTTGNTIDLATTSNFNVRWDGGSAILFGLGTPVKFGDLDSDDKQDLVFGSSYTDYNSRADSGSSWIVFNTLIDDYVGTGNVVNISTSANYNVRIDGSVAGNSLHHTPIGKIDTSGDDNLFLYEFPSLESGSIYMIGNSELSAFSATTGNTLDLANTSHYNLKITSAGSDWPYSIALDDYTNDSYNDLVVGANYAAQNSRADSGSTYILSGSNLNGYLSSTGNTFNIASASDYIYRIDGATAADYTPYRYTSGDFNDDGVLDSVVSTQESDYNSRNNSGSVWLIYGYPHSVTPGSSTVTTSDTTPALTGSITATNSLSTVASVEYRVDSNTITGSWTACTASDGTFNSTSESYTCTLSTQTVGAHTVYIRSVDSNGVKTAQASYGSVALTIDASGPTYSAVSATHLTNTSFSVSYTTDEASSTQLEYGTSTSYGSSSTESDTGTRVTAHTVVISGLEACTTYHYRLLGTDGASNTGQSSDFSYKTGGCASSGGTTSESVQISQGSSDDASGVFQPVKDSYTGGQEISVIVEQGTFDNDAYLSAIATEPSSSTGILTNLLTGTLVPTSPFSIGNAIVAGGDGGVLGIKQACGIAWQVGEIQQMWYKTYPPKGTDKAPAIIIPDLQKKQSIIALSYNPRDLTPPGQPNKRFNSKKLSLARSIDGITWKILPTSVVDQENGTVAALDKVGGFYMIVSGCQGGYAQGSSLGVSTSPLKVAPSMTNQDLPLPSKKVQPRPTEVTTPVKNVAPTKSNQDQSLLRRISSFLQSVL